MSAKGDTEGFPSGSVVEYALDGAGQPLLSLSTLSSHTRDLQTNGRCSLTVMAPGFKVRGQGGRGHHEALNLSCEGDGNIPEESKGMRVVARTGTTWEGRCYAAGSHPG